MQVDLLLLWEGFSHYLAEHKPSALQPQKLWPFPCPKVLRELLISLWGGESANGVGDEQIRGSHTDSPKSAAIWKFCDGCWSFPMVLWAEKT